MEVGTRNTQYFIPTVILYSENIAGELRFWRERMCGSTHRGDLTVKKSSFTPHRPHPFLSSQRILQLRLPVQTSPWTRWCLRLTLTPSETSRSRDWCDAAASRRAGKEERKHARRDKDKEVTEARVKERARAYVVLQYMYDEIARESQSQPALACTGLQSCPLRRIRRLVHHFLYHVCPCCRFAGSSIQHTAHQRQARCACCIQSWQVVGPLVRLARGVCQLSELLLIKEDDRRMSLRTKAND